MLARLCHDSGGFASTRGYLHVAERVTGIARQNEGWIKKWNVNLNNGNVNNGNVNNDNKTNTNYVWPVRAGE